MFFKLNKYCYCARFHFTYSEGFPEQREFSKLKLLKNGNTFLINVAEEMEIHFTLYKEGKSIATSRIKPKFIEHRLKMLEVSATYEINNEVVIFLMDFVDRTPVLIRLIIDGDNAQLKSEERILSIATLGAGASHAMYYGDVKAPGFLVEKDPDSDFYAVLIFDSFAKESNKRIEVVHYSPQHKEINRAYFSSPENNTYKYLNYLCMEVKADEYVIIGSYVFNTKFTEGGEKSKIFISKLQKGTSAFKNVELPYTEAFKESNGVFQYDSQNNLLYLILETNLNDKKTNIYTFFIQPVNPENLSLSPYFLLPNEKANEYFLTKIDPGSKKGFQGMPQNYIIDQKGRHLVLFQKTLLEFTSGGNFITYLQEIGLTSFDKTGKEDYGIIIPCHYSLEGRHTEFTYCTKQKGFKGNAAKVALGFPRYWLLHIDLVPTKNNNYNFINNLTENFDAPDNIQKRKMVAVSNLNATYYKINEKGEFTRGYLFGKPSKPNLNKFCNFNSSDYNANTGEYVTIVTEEVKGEKVSKVVWFNLEK